MGQQTFIPFSPGGGGGYVPLTMVLISEANTNLVAGEMHLVDCQGGVYTATLPATGNADERVGVQWVDIGATGLGGDVLLIGATRPDWLGNPAFGPSANPKGMILVWNTDLSLWIPESSIVYITA